MSPQYGELGPTSGWDRFVTLGHPTTFQLVSRLGSVSARYVVVGVSKTLRRWIEGATYARQGDRHVGHWPTFSSLPMKLPASKLIQCVSKFCLDEWQVIWVCCEGYKLHSIYPTVGIVKHSKIFLATIPSYSIDSELVIPVSLTHTYCVVMTPQPVNLVEFHLHILVECANLRDIREKYFTVSSVADLFKSTDNHTVINFIKETHFTTNGNVCYFNFILAL